MPASVAFVTHVRLGDKNGRVHSNIGALRRHLILPAEALRARGIRTHIVSLATWPHEQLRRILRDANRTVFSELFATPGESSPFGAGAEQYLGVLDLIPDAAERSLFIVDDAAQSTGFCSELARRGIPQLASANCLEPSEGPPGEPRVPSRSLAQRVGARLARRAGVGLEPWRLRLLWFDDVPHMPAIADCLHELYPLAVELPLSLECVLPARAVVDASAQGASELLNIRVSPWSPAEVGEALSRCDLVLLTRADRGPSRLIEALNAGRFAVGPLLPAFESYAGYARLGDSLPDAIRWVISHPAGALKALEAGQAYVRAHHSEKALAEFWLRQLRLDG